jgi:hypothetical protein
MFQSLVEPCAALVEDFGEVLVEVLGIQRGAGRRVIFFDVNGGRHTVDTLRVR